MPIAEISGALEPLLSKHFGSPQRIKRLRRRLCAYSSSYTIENLEVEVNRGRRLRLVLKDLSPRSLLLTAQQVRPHFLYEPRREIQTYRQILDSERLGTPMFFGAVESRAHDRYWLFLERVTGPLLWQMGRMDSWEQAARWLARLHGEFSTRPGLKSSARMAHLLRYDADFFGIWLTRAEKFVSRKYTGRSLKTLQGFGRLADRYDRVIQRLVKLPTTFIHGEFYPSNVIMRATKKGREICPVDWEVAAIAPGLIDLATLTSGDWSDENKRGMVSAYRESLETSNSSAPSLLELIEGVEYAQLHIAVQLLGWASDWSPPERHAQNWLQEALRLAKKLGL